MGRINKGILGGFSGKVGTVVGGTWKGIDYMRSKGNKRTGISTTPQLEQQAKFAVTVKFISSMSALMAETFRNYAVKMTGQNSALSYNIKNAITGSYPNYSIDYSQVLISRGELPNAQGITAVVTGTDVKFTWTNNAGTGKAKAGDKAILVVYCKDYNQTIYTVGSSVRADETETLDCSNFAGSKVEAYMAFISEDGKDMATSFYAGQLTL